MGYDPLGLEIDPEGNARAAQINRRNARPILPVNQAIDAYREAEEEFNLARARAEEAKARETHAAMKLDQARKDLEVAARG